MSSLVEVAAVRAIGITKRYGAGQAAVTALDNVTVALPAARFTAIMGRSGSGKSTLLHCLAGLDTVDAGVVYLGDVDLTGRSERELTRLRRDRVGFVFQAYNLLPTLTAGENLLLPVRIAHRTPDRDWIDRVVEAVGLRGGARGYVTKAISGPELCEAIRRVHAGDVYFSPRLAVFVLDSFRGADATETHPDLDRLTRRETRRPAAGGRRVHVPGGGHAARDLGADGREPRVGGAAQAPALQPPRALPLGARQPPRLTRRQPRSLLSLTSTAGSGVKVVTGKFLTSATCCDHC